VRNATRPVFVTAVLAAVVSTGAASASNSGSFADRAGDTRIAPDVTGVAVSTDDAGLVTIRVALGNRHSVDTYDNVLVGIDADQNPDTGGILYGAEAQLSLDGGTAILLLPGSDGLYHEVPTPAWLRAGFSEGAVTFSFNASDLRVSSGFNFYVLGYAKGAVDTAPDIRTYNYQLAAGNVPPPLGRDGRAPVDEALKSKGVHGRIVSLFYYVADGRGETADTIRVLRGKRVLTRIDTDLADSNPFLYYWVNWRVPRRIRGKLRFCVSSVDREGNRGRPSCAPLTIR
jgi:hypothetical protein